jgi:membrane-associated phospholipid phosphatase
LIPSTFWFSFTRLGEAQIVLPIALVVALRLAHDARTRAVATWWMVLLAAAIALTTASKVAGIGWPELDFTGVSGHTMFAAAVYPLLFGALAALAPPAGRQLAVAAGCLLAVLIGLSRIAIGVHSASEVAAGLLLGGCATALTLAIARLPGATIGRAIPVLLAAWLAFMPAKAPASQTHSWVTSLALHLSGHAKPYTREDMLRELRRGGAASAAVPRAGGS